MSTITSGGAGEDSIAVEGAACSSCTSSSSRSESSSAAGSSASAAAASAAALFFDGKHPELAAFPIPCNVPARQRIFRSGGGGGVGKHKTDGRYGKRARRIRRPHGHRHQKLRSPWSRLPVGGVLRSPAGSSFSALAAATTLDVTRKSHFWGSGESRNHTWGGYKIHPAPRSPFLLKPHLWRVELEEKYRKKKRMIRAPSTRLS